jgi:biotin operon repressor
MPQRFHLKRPDLAAAVTTALADCKDVRSHQRLLAMRLAASGQFTAAQIAEQIGISRRQFFHWVNALKAGGVEQLLERDHGGGQRARIQGSALQELQAGLQAGRWKRAKDIPAWLRQRQEPRLTVKGV